MGDGKDVTPPEKAGEGPFRTIQVKGSDGFHVSFFLQALIVDG